MAEQIALVLGATGSQGGGVVHALLQQGKYAVRGLTRNKDKQPAKKLAAQGVEIVQGDLSDKKSLVQAMSGVDVVFAVTDFYGSGCSYDTEVQQGKNVVDAAREAGVKHFVWSGLEDVRKVPGLKEKLKEIEPGHWVSHFESKAAVTDYLESSGLQYTVLETCMFYDNFLSTFPIIPQDDGTFAVYNNASSDAPLSVHDVKDIGLTVAAILKDPSKHAGAIVPVVSDVLSFKEMVAAISDATGKQLKYVEVPFEKAAAAGYPGAADVANMFEYYSLFTQAYNDLRPESKALAKGLNFKEWVAAHRDELIAAFGKK